MNFVPASGKRNRTNLPPLGATPRLYAALVQAASFCLEQIMDNWQQRFERVDPWHEIPFATEPRINPDVLVGIVCIACSVIAMVF